jgi:hypothetical protein
MSDEVLLLMKQEKEEIVTGCSEVEISTSGMIS